MQGAKTQAREEGLLLTVVLKMISWVVLFIDLFKIIDKLRRSTDANNSVMSVFNSSLYRNVSINQKKNITFSGTPGIRCTHRAPGC